MSGEAHRPADRETIRGLVAKYDQPGPRYTSYPTAVELSEEVGRDVYEQKLEEADALGDAPLSLYMHLPFCEERCLFCGCHVIITPHHERSRPYLDLLKKEMALVAEKLPHRRRFAQLHLGGGTPTYYSPEELDSLMVALLADYSPLEGAELAVELDPRVTSKEHLDVLAERGFNRMSLGVQDFTPAVQEKIHRVQSFDETRTVIDHGRRRGYRGINVDLIYGLPLQTPKSFEETVEQVIDMGVDRVACYSFAYVPWLRGHQKKLDTSELPSTEVKAELFALARERFLTAGYEPIGMDHFARPDDELARAKKERRLKRNFQGYAVVPGDDVIGFGISAIGDVRGALIQNEKKLSRYAETIEANRLPVVRGIVRSRDDAIRGDVIHSLMCNFVIERGDVEAAWNIDFGEYFSEALERLERYRDEGLVSIDRERIRATPIGELFVRNLAMCFDRYMWEKHAGSDKPTFSRTV